MINKIITLLIIVIFFSCKNDVKNENATEAVSQETSNPSGEPNSNLNTGDNEANGASQNDFQGNPARTTMSTTTPDGKTVTVPANSTTGNESTVSVPTTSSIPAKSQKVTTPKSTDDVTVKIGKNKQSETRYSIDPNEPDPFKVVNLPLPDPCDLLSETYLKGALKLTNAPTEKPGSRGQKGYEKSCFWRFDDNKKANAGVMLQIMINPYANDVDDFPELIISSKMKDGEVNPYDNTITKFSAWNEVTPNGCYSYAAGKYHWRVGKKYVFMLAFNSGHTEAEQKILAAQIGKEVLKNYKF